MIISRKEQGRISDEFSQLGLRPSGLGIFRTVILLSKFLLGCFLCFIRWI